MILNDLHFSATKEKAREDQTSRARQNENLQNQTDAELMLFSQTKKLAHRFAVRQLVANFFSDKVGREDGKGYICHIQTKITTMAKIVIPPSRMQIQEMAARKKQQLLTHTLSIDQIKACRNSDTQRLSVAALKGIIIATIHNGRATSALAQRHGLSPAQAQRAFSAATKLGLLIKIESFGPNGRKCHWIAKSRKKIPLKHSTVTTFNIPQNWKDNKTLLTWAYHAMAAHVQQQSARHYVKKNQAKGELSSKKHVVQHIIDNYTITTSKAAAAMGLTTQQARKHLQRGTRMNLNIPYPDERVAPQTFPSYLDAAIVACEHNNYVQEEKNNYFAGFGFAVPFKDHAIDGQLWRIKLVFQSRWRITLPVNNPNSFSLRRKTRPIRMAAAGHPLPENMPSFYDDVKYDFEPPTPPMTVTGIRHAATKILQIINEIEQIHLNKNAS